MGWSMCCMGVMALSEAHLLHDSAVVLCFNSYEQ